MKVLLAAAHESAVGTNATSAMSLLLPFLGVKQKTFAFSEHCRS
jgi:hypothetical protein